MPPTDSPSAPPYPLIARQLSLGKVVPFIGAGVNFAQRPSGSVPYSLGCGFLPGGGELAECLWKDAGMSPRGGSRRRNLSLAASCAMTAGGRDPLREYLRRTFDAATSGAPTGLHRVLASVATPMLVMTTNYDTLVERAFADLDRPFLVVTHADDAGAHAGSMVVRSGLNGKPAIFKPNEQSLDPTKTSVIYKIHGSIQPGEEDLDGYVITEDDYIAAFGRTSVETGFPADIHAHLESRHVLFLGYGLQDWNVRVLLNRLRSLQPQSPGTPRRHWAVQFRPNPFESDLWRSRGVNIYDVAADEFARQVQAELAKHKPAPGAPP